MSGLFVKFARLRDVTAAIVAHAAALAASAGASLMGFIQAEAGALMRTVQNKLRDTVSVKDFGAVGTANPANVTADTAAFLAALASGRNVYIPEGTYYLSSMLTVGAAIKLHGAGRGKVTIFYTGTGTAILVGAPGPTITLTYDCECGGFTLICTNRATTVQGVVLSNAVYFRVFDMTIVGSGNPNSVVPADQVLYGQGLRVSNNSILGSIERVSCRIWNYGYYFYTKAASESLWSAAIEVHGGEVANNMFGMVIGDSTVAFSTAVGISFHDTWVQGNYTCGIRNYSGESTVFDNVYFEGNANYDYDQGGGAALPVKNMLHRCTMTTESIGVTAYGNFPYLAKINIRSGSFNSIEHNDVGISTAIPLINVAAAAEQTTIKKNRLNSAIDAQSRIADLSNTTITEDNYPEKPRFSAGVITRTMATASGVVSYTGVGFRPTEIEFSGSVDATVEYFSGSAGIGIGLQQRCMTTDAAGLNYASSDCIRLIRVGAGNEQKASLVSFDADGFTLSWTKVGTPPANDMVVNFIARR